MLAFLVSQITAAGVAVGSPLGIAVMIGDNFRAIGGWNFNRGSVYLSLDRDFYVNSTTLHPMDAYMGFGGYVAGVNVAPPGEPTSLDLYFGIRIPFGLEYDVENSPITLGLEATPVVGIFPATRLYMFADLYFLFRFR